LLVALKPAKRITVPTLAPSVSQLPVVRVTLYVPATVPAAIVVLPIAAGVIAVKLRATAEAMKSL